MDTNVSGWPMYTATLKIGRRLSTGWTFFAPSMDAAIEYAERKIVGDWCGKSSPVLVSVVLA